MLWIAQQATHINTALLEASRLLSLASGVILTLNNCFGSDFKKCIHIIQSSKSGESHLTLLCTTRTLIISNTFQHLRSLLRMITLLIANQKVETEGRSGKPFARVRVSLSQTLKPRSHNMSMKQCLESAISWLGESRLRSQQSNLGELSLTYSSKKVNKLRSPRSNPTAEKATLITSLDIK